MLHDLSQPAIRAVVPARPDTLSAARADNRGASQQDPRDDARRVPVAEIIVALARTLETPLTAILQALPLLEPSTRAPDPTVQHHTVRRIEQETTTVRSALETLTAICELGTRGELRTAPIELGDVLMSIIPSWKPRAPEHTFELALGGQAPTVIADEHWVEQAFNILLEHAVKMSPQGGSIRVSVRARQEEVIVSVRQQARSVAATQLSRLFEPCARLDGCDDVVVGGGLGLTLVRTIVEAHVGRVWAEVSEYTPGLTIVSAWPLMPASPLGLPTPREDNAARVPMEDTVVPPLLPDRLPIERARQVVLLAISDAHLARYVRANLEAERFRVLVCAEGSALPRQIDLEEPDLVLLDTELAGMDAPDALQRLRVRARVPIVVLAHRHDPVECVHALNQGASDYLALPFSVEELVARARAALRAAAPAAHPAHEDETFTSGDLTIDYAQRLVSVGGKPISLSKTEFKLLRALAHHAGMVLSHEALLERVWGPAYQREVAFVWVYIRRLRRKLEPDPAHPQYILTVPGVGYRLVRG